MEVALIWPGVLPEFSDTIAVCGKVAAPSVVNSHISVATSST